MENDLINVYVYNKEFQLVTVVDSYYTLIWTDRYDEAGEFELELPYTMANLDILQAGYYLKIAQSDRCMIIERFETDVSEDEPPKLMVKGPSLESILNRRVTDKVEFGNEQNDTKANVQDAIRTLIQTNIISPSNSNRRISNFIFETSTDQQVTKKTFIDSYDGDNLYDIISDICQEKHIGFRVLLNDEDQFVFSLYHGADRSLEQSENLYVSFSPFYDNMKSSNYFRTYEEFKNVMIVSKSENDRKIVPLESSEPAGLERREIHVSVDDLKKNRNANLSDSDIQTKGKRKLKLDYKIKTGFEGEIIPHVMYEYREHFFIGDKIQFTDIFGNTEPVRISEIVITYDENGLSLIPTFTEVENEEDD